MKFGGAYISPNDIFELLDQCAGGPLGHRQPPAWLLALTQENPAGTTDAQRDTVAPYIAEWKRRNEVDGENGSRLCQALAENLRALLNRLSRRDSWNEARVTQRSVATVCVFRGSHSLTAQAETEQPGASGRKFSTFRIDEGYLR